MIELRDHFAAAALTGILANPSERNSFHVSVDEAYKCADIMLSRRSPPETSRPPETKKNGLSKEDLEVLSKIAAEHGSTTLGYMLRALLLKWR